MIIVLNVFVFETRQTDRHRRCSRPLNLQDDSIKFIVAYVSVRRLECQVRAYPLPAITWHVNGVELAPSPRFIQTVVGEQIVLEIREVTRADAGVYMCRARSTIGEASTSTALIVSGRLARRGILGDNAGYYPPRENPPGLNPPECSNILKAKKLKTGTNPYS